MAPYGREILRWWHTRLRVRRAQKGEAHRSDATLLYDHMLKLLKTQGNWKPAWVTPNEFACLISEPQLALVIGDLTLAYNELRFGGRRDAASRIVDLLAKLE